MILVILMEILYIIILKYSSIEIAKLFKIDTNIINNQNKYENHVYMLLLILIIQI